MDSRPSHLARALLALVLFAGCAPCDASPTDPANCGGCGVRCLPWLECAAGVCRCPAGGTECAASCVDLSRDVEHCGRCGAPCPAGATCVDAECVCPAGEAPCGARCTRTGEDVAHCGACDRACGPDQRCEAGACACASAALDACPTGCFELARDPAHCGACDVACADGARCEAGRCVCAPGEVVCDGRCVRLATDPAHCGRCMERCDPALACEGGRCVCPGGGTFCGAACVDTDRDTTHCGACGVGCRADQLCREGRCLPRYRWSATHPSTGFMPGLQDWDGRVAVSDDGAIYLAFSDGEDVTLVRYGAAGSESWRRRFVTSNVRVAAIAAAPDGGVVLVATYDVRWTSPGRAPFEDRVIGSDVAVVAMDAAGAVRWQRFITSTGWDTAGGVVAEGDRVVVTGSLGGRFDFGGGPLVGRGDHDAFVAIYDAAGEHVASHVFGGGGSETHVVAAFAPDGDLFVAGFSGAGVDLGGGPTSRTLGCFVGRVGVPAFTHRWSRFVQCSEAFGLAYRASGELLLGLEVTSSADFGGVTTTLPSGDLAQLVLALDGTTGAARWARGASGRFSQRARGPVVDARGGVWLAASLPWSAGREDVVLLGIGELADDPLVRSYGGAGRDMATGLATRGDTLALAGRFGAAASFGSGTVTPTDVDVFLVVLGL